MSYCVNCGVELEKTEKFCPLCKTEVVNPREPWREPRSRPYPKQIETIAHQIDRRFFGVLATLVLLIPVLVTVICDLMISGGVTWSGYVIGAIVMLFVWFVLPYFFKKPHPFWFALVDCLIILVFLWLVETVSQTEWFWSLGLPITLTISAMIVGLTALFTRKKRVPVLTRVSVVLFSVGLLCVLIEFFINNAAQRSLLPTWSLFCLIPCVILGLIALVLQAKKDLLEQIRRRLFI